MEIEKLNRATRLQEWAEMVSQCCSSGKTVAAWCAEYGISTKTYYYRLRRVCASIPEDGGTRSLPAAWIEVSDAIGVLYSNETVKGLLARRRRVIALSSPGKR